MPDPNSTTSPPAAANVPAEPPFVLDGTATRGVIRQGSMVIGQYEGKTLVLDLGWCRMADVTIRCLDDRITGENHRGGVAFERAPLDRAEF